MNNKSLTDDIYTTAIDIGTEYALGKHESYGDYFNRILQPGLVYGPFSINDSKQRSGLDGKHFLKEPSDRTRDPDSSELEIKARHLSTFE